MRRVFDDGNLEPSYFRDYVYNPKLVIVRSNMSLGELLKKEPEMNKIISSKYLEFVEGEILKARQTYYEINMVTLIFCLV